MGRLYESCLSVFVYLGPGIGHTQRQTPELSVVRFHNDGQDAAYLKRFLDSLRASRYCEESGTARAFGFDHAFAFIRVLAEGKHLSCLPMFEGEESIGGCFIDLYEALRRMMNPPWTPWWTRIWVVQEVTMPKDVIVVCSSISAPWSMFADAALAFAKHSGSCCAKVLHNVPRDQVTVLTNFVNRVKDIEMLRKAHARARNLKAPEWDKTLWGDYMRYHYARHNETKEEQKSLLWLLQRFRDRKASDPRDKVYALLSLVDTNSDGYELLPNYSLTEKEVFTHATVEIIRASESLSILSTEIGRKFRTDLPSWVPDWDAPATQTNDIHIASMALYRPPRPKLHTGNPGAYAQILKVQVNVIDKVTKIEEVMWGDGALMCRETLYKWWQAIREANPHSQDLSRFWRVICADIVCIPLENDAQNEVLRASSCDELDFINWAKFSERSPFRSQGRRNQHQNDMELYRKQGSSCFGYRDIAYDSFLDFCLSPAGKVWKMLLDVGFVGPGSFWNNVEEGDIEELIDKNAGAAIESRYEDRLERAMMMDRLLDVVCGDGINKSQFIDPETRKAVKKAPWGELLKAANKALLKHFGTRFSDLRYSTTKIEAGVASMDHSIMAATLSRRFFTAGELVGLGPPNTQRGDVVCWIEGGKTPFILKNYSGADKSHGHPPDEEKELLMRRLGIDQFSVVGDCYLHGCMDVNEDDPAVAKDRWVETYLR